MHKTPSLCWNTFFYDLSILSCLSGYILQSFTAIFLDGSCQKVPTAISRTWYLTRYMIYTKNYTAKYTTHVASTLNDILHSSNVLKAKLSIISWSLDWFINWLMEWLIECLIKWLIEWLIELLINLLINSLINWLINRLIDSNYLKRAALQPLTTVKS